MLGLAVHIIWDWNVAVTENVVYLKHPVPSISHFKQIVSVPVEQIEILEIGWALSEGIPLSHKLVLYYNMQTELLIGLIYLTCISQAYLIC